MDIKKFLEFNFLKFIFFSFDGRINRQTWWYSKIFLYLVSFLLLFPLGAIVRELNLSEDRTVRVISFLFFIFSALGVFVDAKRLQDRSINGLLAVVPYVMSIPYHFLLIPESILKPYALIILVIELYILINAGFLKGDEGDNKYSKTIYSAEKGDLVDNKDGKTNNLAEYQRSKIWKFLTQEGNKIWQFLIQGSKIRKFLIKVLIILAILAIISSFMDGGDNRPTDHEDLWNTPTEDLKDYY